MVWLFLIPALLLAVVYLDCRRDKTIDFSIKCPICKSNVSVLMSDGMHHCSNCDSSFTEYERWVSKIRCKHCKAKAVNIMGDGYNGGLFAITFGCGREIHYYTGGQTVKDTKCKPQIKEEEEKPEDSYINEECEDCYVDMD